MGAKKEAETALRAFPTTDRLIFLIYFITIAIPMVLPMGLPLNITPFSIGVYDAVEALPPGSIILHAIDSGTGAYTEWGPGDIAVFRHYFKKVVEEDCKVIFVTTYTTPDGQICLKKILSSPYIGPHFAEAKYGEDWVNLGWIPGYESTLAAVVSDLHKIAPVDGVLLPWTPGGQSTDKWDWLANVRGGEEIDLFGFDSTTSPDPYPRQWGPLVGQTTSTGATRALVAVVCAATASWIEPYAGAGLVQGYLVGQRGSAEYEKLMGYAGLACSYMDAQSTSHLMAIGLIIVANLHFFYTAKRRRE